MDLGPGATEEDGRAASPRSLHNENHLALSVVEC